MKLRKGRQLVATVLALAASSAAMATGAHAVTVPPSQLTSGQRLAVGQELMSPNQYFRFVMQGDGNVVLYDKANHAMWASNTANKGGNRLIMQGDGNLVLYTAANKPIWASNTANHAGAAVRMQDDGNVVVFRGSTPLWASQTSATCEAGEVCFYDNNTATGFADYDTRALSIANYGTAKFHNGVALNDHVSSIFNNSDAKICFFTDANFTGSSFCMDPHTKNTALGGFDNQLSSHRIQTVQQNVVDWANKIAAGGATPDHALFQSLYPWAGGHVPPYIEGGGWGPKPGPNNGGIDCGGFTRWVYALGTARDPLGGIGDQSKAPGFITVDAAHAVPGDLVVWPLNSSDPLGHIGVFMGGNDMVDAASSAHPVGHHLISNTDAYKGRGHIFRHYVG